jgi:hypothetical protein
MTVNQDQETLPFDKAIREFECFIAKQGLSTDLLWVFREDISSFKRRILIKEPLPEGNLNMAEALYKRGCAEKKGIRLEVLCLLGARPCCYVWVPRDRDEAERNLLLLSGFIMSIPEKLLSARGIRNPLAWAWYKWLDRKRGWNELADRVPRRDI